MVKRREAAQHIISYRVVPSAAITQLMALGKSCREMSDASTLPERTLIISAEDDGASSPKAIKQFADAHGVAAQLILKNSNHHIFWDYDREKVYSTILEFMRR